MPNALTDDARSKGTERRKRHLLSLRSVLVLCIAGVQFVSVFAVIFLIYFGMNRAILEMSEELLEQHTQASVERITNFFLPSVQLNEMLVKLVESGAADAKQNQLMERLFYSALRTSPEISGIYFGRPDGSFIHVSRQDGSDNTTTKTIDAPGKGATFLTRDQGYIPIHRNMDPYYSYEPRTDIWYVTAGVSGSQIMTDTSNFFLSGRRGLTLASPAYRDGELLGVFGTDIEIRELGRILKVNGDGPSLTSSILTTNGDVVVYVKGGQITEFITADTLSLQGDTLPKKLFDRYAETNDSFVDAYGDTTENGEGGKILASIQPLKELGLPWLLATHSPQSELTGALLENTSQLFWTTMLLLAFMALLVIPLAEFIRKPFLKFGKPNDGAVPANSTDEPWMKAPYAELETVSRTIASEISKRQNSEVQYDRTFNASARGMARIDHQTLRFLHVNNRLCQMLGMPEHEVLESGLDIVLINSDQRKTLGRFRDAVTSDKEFVVEADFKSGQNEVIPLRMTAFLMHDSEGNPDHAFAIFDDNEESKKTAAHLENLKRDMERIGRINLMGQFAAGMAHELNQPLGALVHDVDSAQLVLKEINFDRTEMKEILIDIDGHAQRAGEIIRALRHMIDNNSQSASSFDLNSLLKQTLAIVNAEATAYDVNMDAQVSDDYIIIGNRVQIAQALVNLVRNAISALSENEKKYKLVSLKAIERDGQIVISVEDNGPGFPPHLIPFTQFESTGPDGLGLGLSISKSLVEVNNGTILYNQSVTTGARFEISLPGRRLIEGQEQDGRTANGVRG